MRIMHVLSAFALRQVFGEAGDSLMRALGDRFGDQSQRVLRALHRAGENTWRSLEIALAGEGLWSRLDRPEDRSFRQQVRAFLDAMPLPELAGKDDYRSRCLAELRDARRRGLVPGQLPPEELTNALGTLAAFSDPGDILEAERKELVGLADDLERQDLTALAWLLRQPVRPGQSLLVVAVRYFFRREVEADALLARGLVFSQVEELTQAQEEGFQRLDAALHHHGARLAEALDHVGTGLAAVRQSVRELGQKVDGRLESLHDDLRRLLDHFHLREPPPAESPAPAVREAPPSAAELRAALDRQLDRLDLVGAMETVEELVRLRPEDPELRALKAYLDGRKAAAPTRPVEERLLPVLRAALPQADLHVAPDIPPRKLANACQSCQVPADEQVLAVIDATVFGSAKNAMVFGRRAIYFHNDHNSKSAGPGIVVYTDFSRRVFRRESWSEVSLDGGQTFNRSGSQVASQKLVELLQAVQRALAVDGRGMAP